MSAGTPFSAQSGAASVGQSLSAVFDAQLARIRQLGAQASPANSPFARLLTDTLATTQTGSTHDAPPLAPALVDRLRGAGLVNAQGNVRSVDDIWRDATRVADARDGGAGAAMLTTLQSRDAARRARELRGYTGRDSIAELFDGTV